MEHKIITLYCGNCGYSFKASLYCGNRLCEQCKKRNYARLLHRYNKVVSAVPSNKLSQLTLTYKNFQYLNSGQVVAIRNDLRKLRATKFFQDRVNGGLAVIEIKHVSDDLGWNLHIHILIDGFYVPHGVLSSLWHSITGHSYIVDVRREENSKSAFYHLLKYFLKTPIIKGSDEEDLKRQFNDAFRGSRNVMSFGSMYNPIDEGAQPYHLHCPMCGHEVWLSEFEMFNLEKTSHEVNSLSP